MVPELSGRSLSVSSDGGLSKAVKIWCMRFTSGLCILGPLSYVTYASKLQEVAEKYGVRLRFHGFADDSQLYKSVRIADTALAKQTMINCVLDIQRWSCSQRLQLNA